MTLCLSVPFFLYAVSLLSLKHHLQSLIVLAPLDQFAALPCLPWDYILSCDTRGWNTAASSVFFFHTPSKLTNNPFFSIISQLFAIHQLKTILCLKSHGISTAKPFPGFLVRGNVDAFNSQDCFWRWKQFMWSCGCLSLISAVCFPFSYTVMWFYFLESQAMCSLKYIENFTLLCIETQWRVVKWESWVPIFFFSWERLEMKQMLNFTLYECGKMCLFSGQPRFVRFSRWNCC